MTAQDLAGASERRWEASARPSSSVGRACCGEAGWPASSTTSGSASACRPDCWARLDGERGLTDLGHVAELLYAEAMRSQLGLAALRAWLARRISEAGLGGGRGRAVQPPAGLGL